MRIAGITYESFVDGPGLRVVLFAQGCNLYCPGCHNPESWDINSGEEYTVRELIRMIKKPRPGRGKVKGVTFSGGDPFMQAAGFAEIAAEVKSLGMDITTYTGNTYEELIKRTDDEGIMALLNQTDYLIDGPYVRDRRSLDLKFRGSDNQRIIDMNATRAQGEIVLLNI